MRLTNSILEAKCSSNKTHLGAGFSLQAAGLSALVFEHWLSTKSCFLVASVYWSQFCSIVSFLKNPHAPETTSCFSGSLRPLDAVVTIYVDMVQVGQGLS